MNRRKLLRTAGASVTTIPVIGAVAASGQEQNGRTFEEHAAQARKIREQTGSQKQYLKYHQAHADRLSDHKIDKPFPTQSSGDDVSTDKLVDDNVTLDLSVAYYLNEGCGGEDQAQIDLNINIDTSRAGEPEDDNIGIAWNDDHYRYEEATAYKDGCTNCSVRNEELNGVSFDWDDKSACYSFCNTSFSVGCHAELLATDQERAIQAEHNHTWSDTSINNVGFSSSGGIIVNVSDDQKSEEIGFTIAEEPFDVDNFC